MSCVGAAYCTPYAGQVLAPLVFGHDLPAPGGGAQRVSLAFDPSGTGRFQHNLVGEMARAQFKNLPNTVKAFVAAHQSQQRLICAKAITAGDIKATNGVAHVLLGNMN